MSVRLVARALGNRQARARVAALRGQPQQALLLAHQSIDDAVRRFEATPTHGPEVSCNSTLTIGSRRQQAAAGGSRRQQAAAVPPVSRIPPSAFPLQMCSMIEYASARFSGVDLHDAHAVCTALRSIAVEMARRHPYRATWDGIFARYPYQSCHARVPVLVRLVEALSGGAGGCCCSAAVAWLLLLSRRCATCVQIVQGVSVTAAQARHVESGVQEAFPASYESLSRQYGGFPGLVRGEDGIAVATLYAVSVFVCAAGRGSRH